MWARRDLGLVSVQEEKERKKRCEGFFFGKKRLFGIPAFLAQPSRRVVGE